MSVEECNWGARIITRPAMGGWHPQCPKNAADEKQEKQGQQQTKYPFFTIPQPPSNCSRAFQSKSQLLLPKVIKILFY